MKVQKYKLINGFLQNKTFSILALLVLALILMSSTCERNEEIRAVVTVKLFSDTSKVVPNAYVRLTKYDVDVLGRTNSIGQWEHIFPNEVILDAFAWTLDADSNVVLWGETTIRMRQGRTTYQTILVK